LSQYQYHQVINIPEVAGIVSVVAPATADGTNVTVPEVDPGKTIDKIPVKAWLLMLYLNAAVVPIKRAVT
jgi:predicted RNA-binding protein with PUA-like domain